MRTIDNALTFDKNDIARFRLHCIILLDQQGLDALKLAFPKVSKPSVYRWRKRYLSSGRKLSSLRPHSTQPHKLREMRVPAEILGFIKVLRTKYPRMSKYKLKPFLDEFCFEKNLPTHSVSWIGKVISRYQLFFNTRKPVRRKRRWKRDKARIKYCPKQVDITLGYLQLDGVEVVFEGRHYRFLTAIELKSRQAFVARVPSFSSKQALVFLEDIQRIVPYSIHTVQTDNGSEFEGVFDRNLENIIHLWSYPKKPKTQGYVERFNWTLQDEFINYQIDQLTHDPAGFDSALKNWLLYYNTKRPHQGLNYQTPKAYLLDLLKQTEAA